MTKPPVLRPDPLEAAVRSMLGTIDVSEEDRNNPSLDLANSPRRIAKMLRHELLAGYKPGADEALKKSFTLFESDGSDAMVSQGPVEFHSMCSHHWLPFSGTAFVGYLPDKYLVGASKFSRVLTHYSRMFQIQERLGRQVADFIYEHAKPRIVIVALRAGHYCMKCRGVMQPNSEMVTTAIRPYDFSEKYRGVVDEFYFQLKMLDRRRL